MRADTFSFAADDQKPIFVHRWRPDEGAPVKGFVHIAHGMAEHGARYARFAGALVAAGYAVHANDHRGHGKTAASDERGWMGPDGFHRAVRDLIQLVRAGKEQYPGVPAVIFGHSMGSYMVQSLLIESGGAVQAAILSGTGGKPSPMAAAGRVVARLERLRNGDHGTSGLLQALSFDAFNKGFRPNRTAFDWLSRDDAEVDAYIADPLCGFAVSTQLWVDVLDGMGEISQPDRQARIPRDLPIYIFAGSEDPVGERTRSVSQLVGAYARAGVKDVTHRFYAGARHETLNETNRDQVTAEVIEWLQARLATAAR
jgi:alpha-beta hydrolase superfamily lysophospholipase